MIFSEIHLGKNVDIDTSSTFNNVIIGDNVKIAKLVSVFGSPRFPAIIGEGSYIGMMSILNGFNAKLVIGKNVSIAQHVNIMTDSGPNASLTLQRIFPLLKGPVIIGDHCWIGADTIIMPNVKLGTFSIIAANSFVNKSFEGYSIIGGNPAKIIRKLSEKEIKELYIS